MDAPWSAEVVMGWKPPVHERSSQDYADDHPLRDVTIASSNRSSRQARRPRVLCKPFVNLSNRHHYSHKSD
jgi:hypothetical protein